MRQFKDVHGREWVATAREEQTPRHHGRFYLVFRPADAEGPLFAMEEVRWQSRASAERTLRTMGSWELQRRIAWVLQRESEADHGLPLGDVQPQPLIRGTQGRTRTPLPRSAGGEG